jgi:hypothetical protein
MWFLGLSAFLSEIKTPPRPTTLAARCACLHFRHRPRPCGFLRLSAFLKRYCCVVAWWSSGRTRTPTKSSRLFFSPLDLPQVPLVDVGKHQLIMMASMKIIRAVAPSGGPGGLYTAVASSSTEYGSLFAEYVTQHKEESGKPAHHDGLHEGHQSGGPIWRPWRPLHSSRLYTAVASSSTEYGHPSLLSM